jgi:hypothetical protein
MLGATISTLGDANGAIAAPTTAIAVGTVLSVWPTQRLGSDGVAADTAVLTRGWAMLRVALALLTVAVIVSSFWEVPNWITFGPNNDTIERAAATSTKRLGTDGTGVTGALQGPWAILGRDGLNVYAMHFNLTSVVTQRAGGDTQQRHHALVFRQRSLLDLALTISGGLLALRAAWSRRSDPGGVRGWAIVIAWLAVAPLPAALAVSGSDASRSIGMVPALALLEAGAIASFWPRIAQRRVSFEAQLVVGITVLAWLLATWVHDPVFGG